MASGPNWKLRRLADRSLRVLERRSATAGSIAAYRATLIPKAQAFIAAYDEARNAEARWKKELGEGKGAITALVRQMRAWLPSFVRDIPGFSASDFADRADVPDDVLADATRLVDAATPDGGAPEPAWRAAFESEIGPVLAAANQEWQEADANDSAYQQLVKKSREAGALFDAELQLFRVTLGAVLGTSDKDYQKLRAAKAAQKDEDDTAPLAGGDRAGQPPAPAPNA